jgi:hypothetical protein
MSRKLIESQEQERARIGRELHDDINQRLAMLGIEIERLQGDPSEIQERVQELRQQTAEISAMRPAPILPLCSRSIPPGGLRPVGVPLVTSPTHSPRNCRTLTLPTLALPLVRRGRGHAWESLGAIWGERGLRCVLGIRGGQILKSRSLAPDGTLCTADTKGLLKRAHVVAGGIRYVGKERIENGKKATKSASWNSPLPNTDEKGESLQQMK